MQIGIKKVAELCGLEPVRHRSNYYKCPFCGSKSFNLYEKFDSFSCFGCQESGGIAALYGKLNNLPFSTKDEIKEIFSRIYKGLGVSSFTYDDKEENKESFQIPEAERATPDTINMTYRALLSVLSLSDKHREDLHRRGLTDADIELYQFRSTPVNAIAAGKTAAIVERLQKKGFQVKGVPGFYRNRNKEWDINFYEKINGILCPVFDSVNRITGFQIRLDEPYDGRKYIWLTSKGKYFGVSSGSPCTYLNHGLTGVPIVITEGILKATVYHALTGHPVIGQPGISQIDDCCFMLKQIGADKVIEAYDMDRFLDIRCKKDYKPECENGDTCPYHVEGICVKKARKSSFLIAQAEKIYQKLQQDGVQVCSMRWDIEDGVWSGKYKGCDDAALAGIDMFYV